VMLLLDFKAPRDLPLLELLTGCVCDVGGWVGG
jgi:hypothetical protein